MTCILVWERTTVEICHSKIYTRMHFISAYMKCVRLTQTEIQYCLFAMFIFTLEVLKEKCDFFISYIPLCPYKPSYSSLCHLYN